MAEITGKIGLFFIAVQSRFFLARSFGIYFLFYTELLTNPVDVTSWFKAS